MAKAHIREFDSMAVAGADALEVFQTQWAIYQKLVTNDGFSHEKVGHILQEALSERFAQPFSFLDIACGDASLAKAALSGTQVCHYHGIDMAAPAIQLAAINLASEPYDVDLEQRDFVAALTNRQEQADAVWCGLSLHHLRLEEKLRTIRAVRKIGGADGIFLFYEPTLDGGENLNSYLGRTRQVMTAQWLCLTPAEAAQVWRHISTCDLPESAETWLNLGLEAGFSRVREIFTEPNRLYRIYRYDA